MISCEPISWVRKTAESNAPDEPAFISIGQKYVYGVRDSCIVNAYVVKTEEKAQVFARYCKNGYRHFPNGTSMNEVSMGLRLWINDKVDIISYSEDSSYAEIRFRNPFYEEQKSTRYRSLPFYTEYTPAVFLHDTTNYTLKICEPIFKTPGITIADRVVPGELGKYPKE